MVQPLRTVAVLIANPALSSILSMTLAGVPSLRVRPFESELALRSYLRLAPADLVVADFDSAVSPAHEVAESLRADATIPKQLQIIALASALSIETKAASIHAGIDEIIMKPMSPRYLVERVVARLAKSTAALAVVRRGLHKRDWSKFGDNVVPLFRPTPQPQA